MNAQEFDTSWMVLCSIYFIEQKKKGYPDQAFYNEYDFVCKERWNK